MIDRSISDSSKTEAIELTVSASLKLAKIFLAELSFRERSDVVCLAIKLLFSSIQQWQTNKAYLEKPKKEYVRHISEKVVTKLKRVFSYDMPDNYQSDDLKRELQVRIIIMQWCRNPSKWSGLEVSLLIQ